MPGDASKQALIGNRLDRLAPQPFGTSDLRQLRQLARTPQRDQRSHGGGRLRLLVLRRPFHQVGYGGVVHGRVGFVADDVGQHRGI